MISKSDTKSQYALLFLSMLGLYFLTFAPGLVWQDSGMIQYRIWENDIKGDLGLALSHPLYYIVSIMFKFIPWLNYPLKVNLVSPVASAFAVANIFLLIKLLLKSSAAALIGALSLAMAHTFWRHATIPETYNLYTGLFVLELVLLYLFIDKGERKFIYGLFFVNGLSIATHMFGILPLAVYLLLLVYFLKERKINFKHILIIGLSWAIGSSPYLYLIVNQLVSTGDLAGTISSALFGDAWKANVLNAKVTGKILLQNILFSGLNFPTPNIFLAFAGLVYLKKYTDNRVFTVTIYALAAIFLSFASRYTVVDRYAFFIPFYCMTAIFIGVGAKWILDKFYESKKLAAVILTFTFFTVPVYFAAPVAAKMAGFSLGTRGDIAYRDDYQWFLQPWRTGYMGADKYAKQVLTTLKPGSVVIADGTTLYPLALTQQVKGIGENVIIYSSHGSFNTADDYSMEFLMDKAREKKLYATTEKNLFTSKYPGTFAVKSGVVWQIRGVITKTNNEVQP